MTNAECRHCGHADCGSNEDPTGAESRDCLGYQLSAANERVGRMEKALKFYADPLKHNLMGEVNEDHGAIAREALEVPDAV